MGPALRRAHELRQPLGGDPAKRRGGSPLALRTKNAPALDLQARESKRGRTCRREVACPRRRHRIRSGDQAFFQWFIPTASLIAGQKTHIRRGSDQFSTVAPKQGV